MCSSDLRTNGWAICCPRPPLIVVITEPFGATTGLVTGCSPVTRHAPSVNGNTAESVFSTRREIPGASGLSGSRTMSRSSDAETIAASLSPNSTREELGRPGLNP